MISLLGTMGGKAVDCCHGFLILSLALISHGEFFQENNLPLLIHTNYFVYYAS